MKKIIIIGGNAAGTMAAVYLRQKNKEIDIKILEETNNTLYSPCALPFVLSKEIESIDKITVFNKEFYLQNGIEFVNDCKVEKIDPTNNTVKTTQGDFSYDYLVIATGSRTFIPPIKGIDNVEYFSLKTKEDEIKIDNKIQTLQKGSKVTIIGGGLIGIETAHSLKSRGMDVSVVEIKDRILSVIFDKPVVNFISSYLIKEGLKIYEGVKIKEITKKEVILENEKRIEHNLLIISTGVRTNIEIAKEAGIPVDKGILVDESLRCKENIFAIGDCIEPINSIDKTRIMSQLGTSAVHEAKIAAINIDKLVRGDIKLDKINNILNTSVARIGNLIVGSSGFTKEYATMKNINAYSGVYIGKQTAEYYPNDKEMIVYLVSDETGRIIGGQVAGFFEILGRIDLISLAIQKKLNLRDIVEADFAYTPPLVDINEPLSIAAEVCLKRINNGKI